MESSSVINRYIFQPVKSNMYVIVQDFEAVLIDPNVSDEAFLKLKKNDVTQVYIILTHEHPDHTSGVNWFKERFASSLLCQIKCAESISLEKNNRPMIISLVLRAQDKTNGTQYEQEYLKSYKPYACTSDVTFVSDYFFNWKNHVFYLKSTPGHSPGSCCILFDNINLFTGDSLLKEYDVITRFPGGSKKQYENVTVPYFRTLAKNTVVYPGHGDRFFLSEKVV